MTLFDRATYRLWIAYAAATTGIGTAFGQLEQPEDIEGLPQGSGDTESIKNTIVNLLGTVLNFLALIAVIFIVIAGIRLIVSQGEEQQKDKAKKTIIYVIVGLIVILLARIIVGFFSSGVVEYIE
jgi:type IV secretory pathway VirB2 component (pilin)